MPRKVAKGHLTDWMKNAREQGIDGLEKFMTNKTANQKRIVDCRIPTFDALMNVHYSEFNQENKRLIKFLDKYTQFFIRAKPYSEQSNLPKRPLIGVKDFQEMKNFLDDIVQENGRYYFIDILEHHPTDRSAVVISNRVEINIEMINGTLDKLCYGSTPDASCLIDLIDYGKLEERTTWKLSKLEDKDFMLSILNVLRVGWNRAHPVYQKGYFEFIGKQGFNGRDAVVCFDWIKDESYLGESNKDLERIYRGD